MNDLSPNRHHANLCLLHVSPYSGHPPMGASWQPKEPVGRFMRSAAPWCLRRVALCCVPAPDAVGTERGLQPGDVRGRAWGGIDLHGLSERGPRLAAVCDAELVLLQSGGRRLITRPRLRQSRVPRPGTTIWLPPATGPGAGLFVRQAGAAGAARAMGVTAPRHHLPEPGRQVRRFAGGRNPPDGTFARVSRQGRAQRAGPAAGREGWTGT